MRRFLGLLFAMALVAVFFVATAPISAQSSATYAITEQEINAYRLPFALRRFVSSASVDLQPDRAVVTARVIYGRLTLNTVSIWQPVIRNGRLSWRAVSATVDGTPLSADQLALLNNSARRTVEDAIRSYLDSRIRRSYRVESVRITDNEVIITVTFSR